MVTNSAGNALGNTFCKTDLCRHVTELNIKASVRVLGDRGTNKVV